MKRKIIELLIRWWMPKYRLAKIRGPYRKKMKQVSPEEIERELASII